MDKTQGQQHASNDQAIANPVAVNDATQNNQVQSSQAADVSGVGSNKVSSGVVSIKKPDAQVNKVGSVESAVQDGSLSLNDSAQPQPSQGFSGGDVSSSSSDQVVHQLGDNGLSSGIVEPEFPVGGDKERVELRGQMSEVAPVVEMNVDHEIEPEVEGWLEKLKTGEEIKIPNPIVDDQGDVMLADAGSVVVEDKIVMPVTAEEYSVGLQKKMSDSARWLSEWVKKLMSQMGDGAVYRSSPSNKDES